LLASLRYRFAASKFPTRFAGQIQGFYSEGYIDGRSSWWLEAAGNRGGWSWEQVE
jgi:hypothetical protein